MIWRLILTIAGLMLAVLPSLAQDRVALVIGNSRYIAQSPLTNPPNDAADMAAALARLGFEVTALQDATFDQMRRALIAFGRKVPQAEKALVFFAGHGIETGGENYLVPIDAELKSDRDVPNEAVALKQIMDVVSEARQLGLVILDACRNDPFRARMTPSAGRTRSVSRGLAPVEPDRSVLVAYAARENTVADDGSGRNSPFTAALLKHIETPDLDVSFVFRRVRDDVMQATQRRQQPAVYGTLGGDPVMLRPSGRPQQEASAPAAAPRGPAPPSTLARPSADVVVPPTAMPGLVAPLRMFRVRENVSQGIVNVRSGPGTVFPIQFEIAAGTPGVGVGECRPPAPGAGSFPWCFVNWNGRTGWVSSNGLTDGRGQSPR